MATGGGIDLRSGRNVGGVDGLLRSPEQTPGFVDERNDDCENPGDQLTRGRLDGSFGGGRSVRSRNPTVFNRRNIEEAGDAEDRGNREDHAHGPDEYQEQRDAAGEGQRFYEARDEPIRGFHRDHDIPPRPFQRQVQPVVHPRVKAPPYDGTSSWQDYLIQFEMIADLNGWNNDSRALYLAAGLRGAAQEVLGDLDAARRRQYAALLAILNQRFGPDNQAEMFRSLLRNKTRKSGESLPELAHSIRRLVKQSYPTADYDLLESLAKDHFIDALPETDCRWTIQQARPRNLDEAVQVAVELEAFHIAEKHRGTNRKMTRVVRFEEEKDVGEVLSQEERLKQTEDAIQGLQQTVNKGFQALKDRFNQLSVTGRGTDNFHTNQRQGRDVKRGGDWNQKPVECYHCGQLGHIRPNCPKYREEWANKRHDDT